MDIQLKRGLLDVCVLAAIKQEDSYGYKIIKDMKPYVELSESTLYPILRRLEAAQLLSVHSAEHNGCASITTSRNRGKSGLNISKPSGTRSFPSTNL